MTDPRSSPPSPETPLFDLEQGFALKEAIVRLRDESKTITEAHAPTPPPQSEAPAV